MTKKTFKITGMHCNSCALGIEWELEDQGYVSKCDYAKEILEVEFDSEDKSEKAIKETVEKLGYKLNTTQSSRSAGRQ